MQETVPKLKNQTSNLRKSKIEKGQNNCVRGGDGKTGSGGAVKNQDGGKPVERVVWGKICAQTPTLLSIHFVT